MVRRASMDPIFAPHWSFAILRSETLQFSVGERDRYSFSILGSCSSVGSLNSSYGFWPGNFASDSFNESRNPQWRADCLHEHAALRGVSLELPPRSIGYFFPCNRTGKGAASS